MNIPVTFGASIEPGDYILIAKRNFSTSAGNFTMESNPLKITIAPPIAAPEKGPGAIPAAHPICHGGGHPMRQLHSRGHKMQNCTWHAGWLSLTPSTAMAVVVRDSAFDGTLITASGYAINSSYAYYVFDAFTNASEEFPIGSDGKQVVLGGFNWQSSWFGNYYSLASHKGQNSTVIPSFSEGN